MLQPGCSVGDAHAQGLRNAISYLPGVRASFGHQRPRWFLDGVEFLQIKDNPRSKMDNEGCLKGLSGDAKKDPKDLESRQAGETGR